MSYYEKLSRQVDKAMRNHPQSMVVMDSNSFKVIATGRDSQQLSRKLKASKSGGISVVFQMPRKNAVWILAKWRNH